jgi:3D (Asp-Asp-Asp) domain-containing protein
MAIAHLNLAVIRIKVASAARTLYDCAVQATRNNKDPLMKRFLGCLATLALALYSTGARAQAATTIDPVGDLIHSIVSGADVRLKATLYHAGERGMRALDSLGCNVVAMRTAAVSGVDIPRRTVLFIKETVGLTMPDGSKHDGYWYASDVGPAIHNGRIDLFTGRGAASMAPLMTLNLATLTVMKVGQFQGCPPN